MRGGGKRASLLRENLIERIESGKRDVSTLISAKNLIERIESDNTAP